MNKTNINWGYPNFYTWNIVSGCKRGCEYCYARRIHERFNKTPFNEITYHENRLLDKGLKAKKPRTIFVGSMSDIEYWRIEWTDEVIEVCKKHPHHTFMFLTKNPIVYNYYTWPANTWQGLTMTCEQEKEKQEDLINTLSANIHPFLSIEPLLGLLKVRIPEQIEKIICGAMTGQGAIKPKMEWIDSVRENIIYNKERLFFKPNIRKYL